MTSRRLIKFLATETLPNPCLVIDLEVVAERFGAFRAAMPDSEVFYAVKANPAPEILALLAGLGSSFDAASVDEIEQVLAVGASPDRISYGNTIKKERDIARAFGLGIDVFAVDCIAEVQKVARAAPGSRVYCRIHADGHGADWALGHKFGCPPDQANEILDAASRLGLRACGLSFHVGSQQSDVRAFERSLKDAAAVFSAAEAHGSSLSLINLGGGFPATYLENAPDIGEFADSISGALRHHFGNRTPKTIIEPGRGLVGDAGVIQTEIVLISQKVRTNPTRWIYLDIGRFGGLAETMNEAIRYPVRSHLDGDPTGRCILAGPTCDSVDVLYQKIPYELPLGLSAGDKLLIESTGAYTASYSSVGFNGFPPLPTYVI